MSQPATFVGPLVDEGRYLINVPGNWEGTLILYSQGPPAPAEDPVWSANHPALSALLARGYALAGWTNPVFWPLEHSFPNQEAVLDEFASLVNRPRRTIAYGQSIGGFITAGLVQRLSTRLDGALAVCGPLAGGVAIQNRELDIAFTFKTLLAPESALDVVRIQRPGENLRLALEILDQAAATPEGRARLALTAAVSNIPGSADPLAPTGEPRAALERQIKWYREIVFLVIFQARAIVERRARGNFSWNTGVDYGNLLERSINVTQVRALYAEAGLDLGADLRRLADAARIDADEDAVAYLERHIVYAGELAVPVVTLHTTGDGLCTPDHEHAYADVVRAAGRAELLRQLWVRRGGHCDFTIAETLTALDVLNDRIELGSWPASDSATLNLRALELGEDCGFLVGSQGGRGATAEPPRFCEFVPWPFSRPYDARSTPERRQRAG
ncbi:alpha/beta hydrolase [soil metagenome]